MNALMLDASVLLAAFDTDDVHHTAARSLLLDTETSLATLDLARYETTNVAVRSWRAPEKCGPLLAAIESIAEEGGVISSDQSLLDHAVQIAVEHAISVYDATYCAAAHATGRILVSCDVRDLVSKQLACLPERHPV